MLRVLTCMSIAGPRPSLGGFVSERRAASNRNGGRHHVGMVGGFKSENLGGFARNSQSWSSGNFDEKLERLRERIALQRSWSSGNPSSEVCIRTMRIALQRSWSSGNVTIKTVPTANGRRRF